MYSMLMIDVAPSRGCITSCTPAHYSWLIACLSWTCVPEVASEPDTNILGNGGSACISLTCLLACLLQVSHRLLHVRVSKDYRKTTMDFASEHVGRLCGDAFARQSASRLGNFLDLSAQRSELGGIRGILFERYWHRLLLLGGKFEMRDLEEGEDKRACVYVECFACHHVRYIVVGT